MVQKSNHVFIEIKFIKIPHRKKLPSCNGYKLNIRHISNMQDLLFT